MDAFIQKFVEEAREFLGELEEALLQLESSPDDPDVVGKVFRIMHTLKGNSLMFGFNKIDELTHQLENLYDKVRNGEMMVSKQLLDLTLQSLDHIGNLLDEENCDPDQLAGMQSDLLSRIGEIGSSKEADDSGKAMSSTAIENETPTGGHSTYYIYFQPEEEMLRNGTNPLYLVDDFSSLGEFIAMPGWGNVPELSKLNPEHCYISWEIIVSTEQDVSAINEVFLFVEDSCVLDIQKLAERDLLKDKSFMEGTTKILEEGKGHSIDKITQLIENLEKSPVQKINGQLEKKAPQPVKNTISSIRVPSEKLDELMNLVSELVTNQASLTLISEQSDVPEIIAIAESMEKITRQLRENTFNISLIPIETIITRFRRLVRDLSSELGKKVDFITEGTETELDKNIIESLADPIMHIIRNSLDHGIEDKETRLKLGKPETGQITLKAFYSGMNVFIQIQDDGAGFDAEKIREKAIRKNLIDPEATLTQKELFDLLFLPGFSTAKRVTDISGRGVGMDVVKRKIEDLRGQVELDSKQNEGSTITIKLPLTLSIIDGLLVTIDNTYFVIQLQVVDKVYEIKTEQLNNSHNKLIPINGELFPYMYLRNEFSINENEPERAKMIVVKYDNYQVGLIVDDIIGEYQAVLKPLGKLFKRQEMVSGATILGDGTVALILDTSKIIDHVIASLAEASAETV